MLGLFGAALAPAPGQASSTWCLPAPEGKKTTLLQKLSLPHPRGWQRSGHSPGHSVPRMEHGCRVTPEQGEHRAEIPPEQGSWGALRQEREAPTAPGEQPLLFLVSTLLAAALHGRCQPWRSTKLAAEEAPMPLQVIFCHCKCPQRVLALQQLPRAGSRVPATEYTVDSDLKPATLRVCPQSLRVWNTGQVPPGSSFQPLWQPGILGAVLPSPCHHCHPASLRQPLLPLPTSTHHQHTRKRTPKN